MRREDGSRDSPAMTDPEQHSYSRADLDRLGEKVAKGRTAAGLDPAPARTRADTAMGDGLRIAIEFVVSVLVGAGLGYFIGGLLGGAVIGLLIGLLFGFAAGLRGVYRGMMAGSAEPAEEGTRDEPGV